MPIEGIFQPEQISVCNNLRLRKYDGKVDFALAWYQDRETLLLVDGKNQPYDMTRLRQMYAYLDAHGELYFIEYKEDGAFIPVGDVTLCRNDLPIVIGDVRFRHRGIGSSVIRALIRRGQALGFQNLWVAEIYSYNIGSEKLFTSLGFVPYESTEKGRRYRLTISDNQRCSN